MRFPPANMQLRRAQLVLMLATLLPTIATTGVGIGLLIVGRGGLTTVVSAILILLFCTSVITGYILVAVFVNKGASLVRVQNDFVSGVSHELRTPITSIRLLIDSLNNNRLEADDRTQVLSLLGRETERLEQLVSRVLELSKLQSSYMYARDVIDVRSLCEESVASFDAVTLTTPAKVTITVEPGLTVVGDRPTLVRALVNLLTNAWKYSGETKVIEIHAQTSGRWIEIAVHDNGRGISRDDKRTIFDQFSRGRAAHESGATGSGLGLSFVRAIVRGHRGRIGLDSRPGETVVTIRIKRRRKPRPMQSAQLAVA